MDALKDASMITLVLLSGPTIGFAAGALVHIATGSMGFAMGVGVVVGFFAFSFAFAWSLQP